MSDRRLYVHQHDLMTEPWDDPDGQMVEVVPRAEVKSLGKELDGVIVRLAEDLEAAQEENDRLMAEDQAKTSLIYKHMREVERLRKLITATADRLDRYRMAAWARRLRAALDETTEKN